MADEEIRAHSQKWYLYFDGWEAADDNLLLTFMEMEKTAAERAGHHPIYGEEFVNEVHEELVVGMTEVKDPEEILERIAFLRKMYDTFNFVSTFDGAAEWFSMEGYVKAKDVIWRQMIQVNEFAIVCYLEDESEYEYMEMVFGPPDAPLNDDLGEVEDDAPEVID